MNASNVASALTDSIIFPWLAFASVDVGLSASQFALKALGGLAWTLIFRRAIR